MGRQKSKLDQFILRLIFRTISLILLAPFKLLIWLFTGSKSLKKKKKNDYVKIAGTNIYKHRFIAKKLLKRELYPNEVVHHINGDKADNRLKNLCVMDKDKHEQFHSWLSWQRRKKGRYPAFKIQKKHLESEYYAGILLEKILRDKSFKFLKPTKDFNDTEISIDDDFEKAIQSPSLQKQLFKQLKKERLKIAKKQKVPAYVIFHDATLTKIAEVMPVSKSLLLQINGVGPDKLEKHGDQFLNIVKNFKASISESA